MPPISQKSIKSPTFTLYTPEFILKITDLTLAPTFKKSLKPQTLLQISSQSLTNIKIINFSPPKNPHTPSSPSPLHPINIQNKAPHSHFSTFFTLFTHLTQTSINSEISSQNTTWLSIKAPLKNPKLTHPLLKSHPLLV